jgi:hypothetical protein
MALARSSSLTSPFDDITGRGPRHVLRLVLVAAMFGSTLSGCSKPAKKPPPTPEAGFVVVKT